MSQRLLKDLKELVDANIISADTAAQIDAYYQRKPSPSSNRLIVTLGILGALLAGSGILLIVGHNWEQLGKGIQTVLAFTPLAIGQALCLYALLRQKDTLWKEGTALFLALSIAACIALIGQIYQVSSGLETFLLTWIGLCLPIVYLMRASSVSMLLIGLVTWYACLVGYNAPFSYRQLSIPYLYPVVILLLLPHYYRLARQIPSPNAFHLHNWLFALSFAITLGIFMERNDNLFEWLFIGYTCLFGIYLLIARTPLLQQQKLSANPFIIIGAGGIIIIFLTWSFNWLWIELANNNPRDQDARFAFSITGLALLLIWAYTYARSYRKLPLTAWDIPALSPLVFAAGVLLLKNNPVAGILLCNAWILALSVYYIRMGAAKDHLGILNFGLLIFAGLAIFRFFDSNFPFIWRGLIFLAAGAGFFIANNLILKKRKRMAKNARV